MVKINKNKENLIKAFVRYEAEQYSNFMSEKGIETFEKQLFEKVLKQIKGLEKIGDLKISNFGNIGLIDSHVCISFGLATDPDYEIRFCPCGCIGHTAFLSKIEKRKGV